MPCSNRPPADHEGLFVRRLFQAQRRALDEHRCLRLVLLLLWEIAAQLGCIDTRFFPAPSKIFETMCSSSSPANLWTHLKASMYRLMWGFLLGGIPALLLGISMGLSRTLRVIVEPIVSATYPIPKSAILPLILLIFGLGEASKS